MVSLLEYFDYRQYLKAYYEDRKELEPFFSYRYMANRLGMDHSLLIKIFAGKRHIADSAIEAFSQLLGHTKKENEYFSTLISFDKCRNEARRKELFEYLLTLKSYSKTHIDADRYEYFQKWYYPAIRSLLDFFPFSGDYDALAKEFSPPISVRKAEKAIALLERLELIYRDDSGRYVVSEQHVTTGDTWRSIAVQAFQKEAIQLSAQSLEQHPKESRDISSVTMSIDKECFDDVKEILRECREAIIKRVNSIEGDTDRLYQLNMQMVPLSQLPREHADEQK